MLDRARTKCSVWLLAAAGGLLLFLAGCDATLKATFENGVITTSQSLFGAFLKALINLAEEANSSS